MDAGEYISGGHGSPHSAPAHCGPHWPARGAARGGGAGGRRHCTEQPSGPAHNEPCVRGAHVPVTDCRGCAHHLYIIQLPGQCAGSSRSSRRSCCSPRSSSALLNHLPPSPTLLKCLCPLALHAAGAAHVKQVHCSNGSEGGKFGGVCKRQWSCSPWSLSTHPERWCWRCRHWCSPACA